MKYHPITDPNFFTNRDFVGKHWTKKYIRAIQAILNATKGSVGRGEEFFYHAFGKNIDEYLLLLYMPEPMIVYRVYFEENKMVDQWKDCFLSLSPGQKKMLLPVIHSNNFSGITAAGMDKNTETLLRFYLLKRDHVTEAIKQNKKILNFHLSNGSFTIALADDALIIHFFIS